MSDAIKTFHALAYSGGIGPDMRAAVVECCLAWDARALESKLDAALAESRKRGEEVLWLNRVFGIVKNELDKGSECPGCKLSLISHHGLLEQALSSTSATAQRIEMERNNGKV